MNSIVSKLGILGFFVCLFIMYFTNHGIPLIRKYDAEFKLLDMQFRYDSTILYNVFQKINYGGRKAYLNYLLLDFCFIACFLIVMLTITTKTINNALLSNILVISAVFRAILDILENALLIILLKLFPVENIMFANICSWVTTFKFIFMYIWIIGIIGGIITKFT